MDGLLQSMSPGVLGVGLIFGLALLLLIPFVLMSSGSRVSGRMVLIAFIGLFGVIILVNLVLAFRAVGTFPGLEVPNSYVASQNFDKDRAAQLALGWQVVEHSYEDGVMTIAIHDAQGAPAPVERLEVVVGRTTNVSEDVAPEFVYEAGRFTAPVELAPGNWLIHLNAYAPDGTLFRQRYDFFVRG